MHISVREPVRPQRGGERRDAPVRSRTFKAVAIVLNANNALWRHAWCIIATAGPDFEVYRDPVRPLLFLQHTARLYNLISAYTVYVCIADTITQLSEHKEYNDFGNLKFPFWRHHSCTNAVAKLLEPLSNVCVFITWSAPMLFTSAMQFYTYHALISEHNSV